MKILLIIIFSVFLLGDDPPKKKKKPKEDTTAIKMQEQRSLNLEELNELNRMFDSLNQKQDTLIKKK